MLHLPPTGSLPAELGTQKDITPLHPHQLCRPLPGCPLLLLKSQDTSPPSPKSFRAVCPTTLSKRPCQDGAVTRLKDTINRAPRPNGLTCCTTCFHGLKLRPCLGCQAKCGLLALTGFTAIMDPASLGTVWDLAALREAHLGA